MKFSQVRDLARRYATGKLSQESYRSQRRALIDSVTEGQVPLVYRQDERAVAASRTRFNTKLLGLVMVSIIVAGICITLFLRHGSKNQADAKGAMGRTAVTAPAEEPGPGLVREFVETDDWTDVSLQNFERRWMDLGADEQTKAKGSIMFPRLTSAVRQQIISEKAVAGSAAASDPHLTELQKLASTLGVATGS